jgi:hypothetical protein
MWEMQIMQEQLSALCLALRVREGKNQPSLMQNRSRRFCLSLGTISLPKYNSQTARPFFLS